MKLLSIVKSPLPTKKWRANFLHGATAFHTDFGANGMQDYTQHKDPERARLYRLRHQKDLDTKNPTRAGYLSYFILWASPNFRANIQAYKNKFNM
jgi:hypothetical protein